jgi:hypothetical protein
LSLRRAVVEDRADQIVAENDLD